MANFECKKCHKPLASGNKCEACKQKKRDKLKKIGTTVLGIAGTIVVFALKSASSKKNSN